MNKLVFVYYQTGKLFRAPKFCAAIFGRDILSKSVLKKPKVFFHSAANCPELSQNVRAGHVNSKSKVTALL